MTASLVTNSLQMTTALDNGLKGLKRFAVRRHPFYLDLPSGYHDG